LLQRPELQLVRRTDLGEFVVRPLAHTSIMNPDGKPP
jgi:hypothetical protein